MESIPPASVPRSSTLAGDIDSLLTDYDTADVVFTVGDDNEQVYAHRALLWARCDRFKTMRRHFWGQSYSSTKPLHIQQPSCNADVFRKVIAFVYTSQIHLTIDAVFEILALAEELGIRELQSRCTAFLTESMTFANAPWFLTLADQYHQQRQSERSRIQYEECLQFVLENAEDVVAKREFLDVSSSVMMQLVSNDQFALEEEEVWRCVLRWAKHKAGVGAPVKKWTETNRENIRKRLTGIINHVRLTQIDSQVFSAEVDPTGVVPVELTLERYRSVARTDRRNRLEDPRLRPRIMIKMFRGSELLKERLPFQALLNGWYGNPQQQWQLLHRASRDGFSSKSFHKNCDEHRPTFVLVLSDDGHLCGGFSDQPWKINVKGGGYTASSRNFLFTLVNTAGIQPRKFDIKIYDYAIAYHTSCGPIFGAGADLCLSNNCNINSESYSNFPHSYSCGDDSEDDAKLKSELFMGKSRFMVKDYEVFTMKGAQLTLP
eukprot:m.174450 g.174450  ORF g.174450 m.174450 type:complete len:490 (+) comp39113_c0_seq1:235-1704(+)